MNYHIFPQDKFFHAYIEDIYKLHQEHNNVFWVRGNKGDSDFFCTSRPITYIGHEKKNIIDRLRSLSEHDKLIVAWFDLFIGECILESGTPCQVYTYLMGGDFYNDPIGYHDFWLYDAYTKRIMDKLHIPSVNLKRKPQNWHKILKEIQQRKAYKQNLIDNYNLKQKTIARIDYIITGAHNEEEIRFAKSLYPTFRAKYIHGSFDQNFDLCRDTSTSEPFSGNRPLKVFLGNSADPCNNHIDACKYILKVLPEKVIVTCPLSYGNPEYSVVFQQWAKKNLKQNFQPKLDFLTREEYIGLLNSMDIMIMYHNRQQALGNIISALCLGKPVFVKRKSPIFSLLTSMNIPNIYSTDMLKSNNLPDICKNAYINRDQTLSIIQEYYSEQSRLNNLQSII